MTSRLMVGDGNATTATHHSSTAGQSASQPAVGTDWRPYGGLILVDSVSPDFTSAKWALVKRGQ